MAPSHSLSFFAFRLFRAESGFPFDPKVKLLSGDLKPDSAGKLRISLAKHERQTPAAQQDSSFCS